MSPGARPGGALSPPAGPRDLVRALARGEAVHEAVCAADSPAGAGLDGIVEGAWGLWVAVLREAWGRPVIAAVPDAATAGALAREIPAWMPDGSVERLGEEPIDDASGLPEGWDRLLLADVLVASARALAEGAPDPDAVRAATAIVRPGDALDPEVLVAGWLSAGFALQDAVEEPGDCARRGGIVDVWGAGADRPVRIEFEDRQVASVRAIDPATQRGAAPLAEAVVVRPGGLAASRRRSLGAHAAGRGVVWVEPERLREIAARLDAMPLGERPALAGTDWLADLVRLPSVNVRALPGPVADETLAVATHAAAPASMTESLSSLDATVPASLEGLGRRCDRLWLFGERPAEAERVGRLLRDRGLPARVAVEAHPGRLGRGFLLPMLRLACAGIDDLLGRARLPEAARRSPRAGFVQPDLGRLHPGDLVVHSAHGIGRYAGASVAARAGVRGETQEFLALEYAEGATLLVPYDEMEQVRRYVGAGAGRPTLDRLRGGGWDARVARVGAAARALAEELLRTQALRQSRSGMAVVADEALEAEFVAAFPYEETPDQREADDAIRADQSAPRPMDRLLCGDVGFGKTEIAMRAAFRAVASGRQVAVLVPTTVLALQHLQTFRGRMAAFAARVDMISRLRTHGEQAKVLESLAAGACDVVIGTHRLLSGDVRFRDLGLVVIDEEQRFGVEHKQALQRLRSQVDVLAMSATPIPRTLHMALAGLRDISNLATPPKERLPIRTVVAREDPGRVRAAIRSELARGGQVFYIHNRVTGLDEAVVRLRELVPEARFEGAHGQLAADALEDVMVRFLRREFDVLVATTILESGIDMPSVNTIVIERADRFGLSQLHQLRGRVGRFRVQAVCLLLLPPEGGVSAVASRRLRALEEFRELGAGFQIALRDLEIRGAGNLLGPEQSGHIGAVGYDLYCRLLAAAVRELKGDRDATGGRCELAIPVRALLPEGYVDPAPERLSIYQRLARAVSAAEIRVIGEEIADRFGRLPPDARALLRWFHLRLRAARAGFSSLSRMEGGICAEVRDPALVQAALASWRGEARPLGPRRLLLPGPAEGAKVLDVLDRLLPGDAP